MPTPDPSFDLEHAERLLPHLEPLLQDAIAEKKQMEAIGRQMAGHIERIIVMGGSRVNVSEFTAVKKQKEATVTRLRERLERIEGYGCLVKDLDMGLLDFPCRIGGQELYLCWKLGEPRISYWHHTHEGFSCRKPIDEALIQDMERGPLQ